LRKEVEDYYKKRGTEVTIDDFGFAHIYSPLYVSRQNKLSKIMERLGKILHRKKKSI